MTLVDEDIQAARRAVSGLERATDALLRHYGDTVDVRRLKVDVSRIGADLDLLCGTLAPTSAAPAAPPPQREKIPDTSYTHDFWMDAEDEGLGHGGGPRR